MMGADEYKKLLENILRTYDCDDIDCCNCSLIKICEAMFGESS